MIGNPVKFGSDNDKEAIHDNVAAEISAITEKASPVAADLVIVEDSAASNVKKKVQVGNLSGSLDIDGLTAITTIDAAADYVPVFDATDSANKKILPTNLGHRYVDRGDPAAADFAVGDLTTDGTWNDLDLSSIVPAGAIAVHFTLAIRDDAVGTTIQFRKNGNSNTVNAALSLCLVANIDNYTEHMVVCDAGRIIEYNAANTTWTTVSIRVRGWWI